MPVSDSRPGVYICWPFCAQKCSYCNFASGVFPPDLEHAYASALTREIDEFEWPAPPDTVYLGGGTPSQMPLADLARILAAIPGRPWREATIEAAPGSITAEAAAAWTALGINRVSLGVQSFVSRELARTGRKHSADTVAHDADVLRAAGIHNISIDLIAGLPGQTEGSWAQSLDWVERLDTPHASVYMLEVDEDSRLGREILFHGIRYGAADVPTDDAIAHMYETAVERFGAAGITRYEISNFARPGAESVHNLKYWLLQQYIGFGADAHSFDGAWRWQNVEAPQDYADRVLRGESPVCSREPARVSEERFFVGLRLSRGTRLSPEEWARHDAPISRFLAEGLLERRDDVLRLTSRGVLLSNEVFEEFIS